LPKGASMSESVLNIAPQIHREYAAEFKELARTTGDDLVRAHYLQMAHIWLEAAARFELSELDYRSWRNSAA
jgi:hypothetical protein